MATAEERRAEAREEQRLGIALGCIGCAMGVIHICTAEPHNDYDDEEY